MKNQLTLLLVLLFTNSNAFTQDLLFDNADKLDAESVYVSNTYGNDDLLFFTNHSNPLPNVDGAVSPSGIILSSVIEADPDFESIATVLSDSNVSILDFDLNEKIDLSTIIMDCEGEVVFVNGEGEMNSYFFPEEKVTGLIHFTDANGQDSTWSSYLKTSNNNIQKTTPFHDYMLLSGTSKDSIIYVNPDGSEIVLNNESEYNGYVIAIDNKGSYAWSYLSPVESFSFMRAITTNDNIVAVGHDKIINSAYIELDTLGNELFNKELSQVSIYEIQIDDNNLYMCGNYESFTGEADLGLIEPYSLPSPNSIDAFLIKYNENKEAEWHQTITGDNIDTGVSLDVQEDNVYVTGCIQRDGVFNVGGATEIELKASGFEDIFIAKYNINGGFKWAYNFGGNSSDIGFRVFSESEELHLFGIFRNTMDMDPSEEDFNITAELNDTEASYFYARYFEIGDVSTIDLDENKLNIYPNPSNQFFEINHEDSGIIALTDMQGNIINTYNLERKIDISYLQNGMYILRLKNGEKEISKKVIVQK